MTISLNDTLAGTSPVDWAHDFLQRAGFPVTPANVEVVYSWEFAESGGGGGMWNPLNTTQGGYAGESDFNSVGVKNYATREDGLNANAKVIHNGYYPMVVGLLSLGNNAQAVVNAITASPWGTRHIQLLDVPGGPVTPPPAPEKVHPQFRPALPIVATLAPQYDAVVLSDYAKGLFSRELVEAARGSTVVTADPKPKNIALFAGVTDVKTATDALTPPTPPTP